MNRFYIYIISIVISSCATIRNGKTYNLKVSSPLSKSKIIIQDSTYDLPAEVKVSRSKDPLPITLIRDSITIKYTIKPRLDWAFYNNFYLMYVAPFALAIDLTNQKRFHYGNQVTLHADGTHDSLRMRRLNFPGKKGQLDLIATLPFANNFYFKPQNQGLKVSSGFWGISYGVDYYYANNRSIRLNAGAITAYYLIPPMDIFGGYERSSTYFLSLSNSIKVKRFWLSYGIDYSLNKWLKKYYDSSLNDLYDRATNKAFGMVLSAHFHLIKVAFVGIVYRPTFFQINPTVKLQYEHSASFEFGYRLRAKK